MSTPDPSKSLAYPLSPDYSHDKTCGIDWGFTDYAFSLSIPRDIAASHISPGTQKTARHKLEALPLYQTIWWYLKRIPHLEQFESFGVPNLVHLFMLLRDCAPKIRSIKMEAGRDNRQGQILGPAGRTLAEYLPRELPYTFQVFYLAIILRSNCGKCPDILLPQAWKPHIGLFSEIEPTSYQNPLLAFHI